LPSGSGAGFVGGVGFGAGFGAGSSAAGFFGLSAVDIAPTCAFVLMLGNLLMDRNIHEEAH